jgi:hypothetical protein
MAAAATLKLRGEILSPKTGFRMTAEKRPPTVPLVPRGEDVRNTFPLLKKGGIEGGFG